ncbi:hypothetical protein HF257_22810 [Pseudomonas sp. WS 5106]|uniref:Uncharacterized protein n=1 Tax=Pseudomonas cremoris TaxID=2724178 RepID=A0A7X1AQH4_9PSED|nr:hypothetical protein [Pseudomonas cremoris]MBC2382603.1 hypothetical protein [Pseudomonas cremoris]MBC2408851.1 hypothetical protein [Pseudomonas cremoris]
MKKAVVAKDKYEFCVLDAYFAPYLGAGDATIRYGAFIIANVETPTGNNKSATLSFDHYAVVTELKGYGLGGIGPLLFARHIASVFPNVTMLEFNLFRQNPQDDPIALRDAREQLFLSLGATCSYQRIPQPGPPRWIVSVRWDRQNWAHPELLAELENRFHTRYKQILDKDAKRDEKRDRRYNNVRSCGLLKWIKARVKGGRA